MARKQRSLRNEKRSIKYAYILNETGSVKLAREGRDWGLKRIKEIYGVTVRFNEREYKKVMRAAPKTQRARDRRYNIFIKKSPLKSLKIDRAKRRLIEVDRGLTDRIIIDEPVVKEKKKRKRLSPVEEGLAKIPKNIKYFDFKAVKDNELKFSSRLDSWRNWSKKDNGFPSYIHEIVEYANKLGNKAIDDSYGYSVAFYMYLENTSFEETFKLIQPDRYIPDLYDTKDYLRKFTEKPKMVV